MTPPITLFLALLLTVSAGHKLIDRERLAPVAARLASTPTLLGPTLLFAAAAAEALAALALCAGPPFLGAALAASLWAIYTLALWHKRGETLDCGCDFIRRERPVGAWAIARPAMLAALAGIIMLLPRAAWSVETPFAACALLSLWLAASELSALPLSQRKLS